MRSPLAPSTWTVAPMRGQRDRHVRRVGGDAVLGVAEDRVVAVLALARGAAGAGAALVAGLRDVLEVAAARALEQVAADGGEVAQLAGGAGEQRLARARGSARGRAGARRGRCCGPRRRCAAPPSAVSSIASWGRRETSTSRCGSATPSFIRSTRFVPPPRKVAPLGGGLDRGGRVARPARRRTPSRDACPRSRRRCSGTRRSGRGCRSCARGSRRASSVGALRARASAIIPTAEHSWPGVQ